MQLAATRGGELGGSFLRPPMGPKTAVLTQVLDWKNVWRLNWLLDR